MRPQTYLFTALPHKRSNLNKPPSLDACGPKSMELGVKPHRSAFTVFAQKRPTISSPKIDIISQ